MFARSLFSRTALTLSLGGVLILTVCTSGAGTDVGNIVFEGTPSDLITAKSTLTGEHLSAYVGDRG